MLTRAANKSITYSEPRALPVLGGTPWMRLSPCISAHRRALSDRCNVMLASAPLQGSPSGGRALLSRLIHDCVVGRFAHRHVVFELQPRRLEGFKALAGTFLGHIDGLDDAVIDSAVRTIRDKEVHKVLIDGSNLGTLAAAIKSRCPGVEVSTFFHNCEARFFWGALSQYRTPRSLGVLFANYLAERCAVRYSDKLICLSERDSSLLRRLYGRGATHILPMAMRDQLPAGYLANDTWDGEPYALFVGDSFYANQAGIAWFAKNVAPHVAIKTYVVGKGFESYKAQFERHGNIVVIGAVDSLAPWYHGARFVVAPIFDGSGMKTKVAEALIYGKKIIGTPEAFSGYEKIAQEAGWVCAAKQEFIVAVKHAQDETKWRFHPALRTIYEELYSYESARRRLETILSN